MKQKIIQEANITEDELNSKIKNKLEQLSGLVSEEGACHIIANDLGIKVVTSITNRVKVNNIVPGMKTFEIVLRATKKFEPREFQKGDRVGRVANVFASDETGFTRLVFWNDQVKKLETFNEGDILLLKNGYIKENIGRKEIHLSESSELMINPEGESVEEIRNETKRKKLEELKDDEFNVDVLGTIVQLFEPRYFEICPNCKRRTRLQESQRYICDEHGEITPIYSYVVNAVIDDGTDTMRIVCFGEQAEKLLDKNNQELLSYKDNLQEFDIVKNEVVGKIVNLLGRVKKNLMFDRIEFNVQNVIIPNPDDELKRLG